MQAAQWFCVSRFATGCNEPLGHSPAYPRKVVEVDDVDVDVVDDVLVDVLVVVTVVVVLVVVVEMHVKVPTPITSEKSSLQLLQVPLVSQAVHPFTNSLQHFPPRQMPLAHPMLTAHVPPGGFGIMQMPCTHLPAAQL